MVGLGLKKLAKQHNMKVDKGVAYGSLFGYSATMSEGAGYKAIYLSTLFNDPQGQFQLETELNSRNLMKEFRVKQVLFTEKGIAIVFHDNPGTMKKLEAFLEWFFPLLEKNGATKFNICVECGEVIDQGQWKLIDGVAFYFHPACARSVEMAIKQDENNRKAEDKGSYASGFVGAMLGASLGAVLWAVVLYMGYVASLVGFVIGWLADKGYGLFRGKNGKGKIAVFILVVIFGVVLGTALGEVATVVSLMNAGELYGLTYGDIPYLFAIMLTDGEYLRAILTEIGIGLLFAGLGIFSILRRTNEEVADTKFTDLK